MVRVVTPPGAIVVGLNDLVIAGGAKTSNAAVLLVAPVPASIEVIAFVVLSFVPAVVPLTATVKVQDDPAAGRLPVFHRTGSRCCCGCSDSSRPHEPVTLGVVATTQSRRQVVNELLR
jgi:hypothetical protein